MNKLLKSISLIFICLYLSGCAAQIARGDDKSPGFGEPYIGTQFSLQLNGCVMPAIMRDLWPVAPLVIIAYPFTILDFILTTSVETVFLPIDLLITPDKDKYEEGRYTGITCSKARITHI